jgi:hypothetical protein
MGSAGPCGLVRLRNLHALRGRDRDLVRPWKTGQGSYGPDFWLPLNLPVSADATPTQKPRRLNPKMLAPTLTYINSRAKLGRS